VSKKVSSEERWVCTHAHKFSKHCVTSLMDVPEPRFCLPEPRFVMAEVEVLPSSTDASVEAGVRVLIRTMVLVNPASASGSRTLSSECTTV